MTRAHHSGEHPTTDAPAPSAEAPAQGGAVPHGVFDAAREERREAILMALLPHAVFDGWSRKALAAAAADAGLDMAAATRAFPGGMAELADYFSTWADRRMLDELEGLEGFMDLKLRERVTAAVRTRIEVLGPHREALRHALSYLALPFHAPRAMAALYRTVDAIWHAVGDTSADFSFYTKRASLGAVYGATVLYWLSDESEGAEATWGFLDRRIADVLNLPRLKQMAGSLAQSLPLAGRGSRLARRRSRRRPHAGPAL